MDEREYENTYQEINARACAFEKAILGRRCGCAKALRFNLADREGVACRSAPGQHRCRSVLALLREKAQFSLGLRRTGGSLPHGQEIKVQVGGLQGIARALGLDDAGAAVGDVNALLEAAGARFGGFEALPFGAIVRDIAAFRGRAGRRP